jgi:hypothetical protein
MRGINAGTAARLMRARMPHSPPFLPRTQLARLSAAARRSFPSRPPATPASASRAPAPSAAAVPSPPPSSAMASPRTPQHARGRAPAGPAASSATYPAATPSSATGAQSRGSAPPKRARAEGGERGAQRRRLSGGAASDDEAIDLIEDSSADDSDAAPGADPFSVSDVAGATARDGRAAGNSAGGGEGGCGLGWPAAALTPCASAFRLAVYTLKRLQAILDLQASHVDRRGSAMPPCVSCPCGCALCRLLRPKPVCFDRRGTGSALLGCGRASCVCMCVCCRCRSGWPPCQRPSRALE